jgi:hypothetical protein
MEHNDIRDKLSEYIDGSIAAEERTEIEAHLKTCLQCSSALEELRKTIGHIKTVEEIEPPAWMTQKIMAKVRAEAVEQKGFFHRLFFPLRIKLPIQAIAVLFLAVTGFYIYQNIQPASRRSEVPTQEFAAKKQAPPTGTEQDKLAKADAPELRSKKFPQAPAYNSLDMKQEYETPPPPVLTGKAAEPSDAGPEGKPALARNEAASGILPVAPQAAAPATQQEQTAPSAGAALKSEGKQVPFVSKKKTKAVFADSIADSAVTIAVSVKDLESAARDTGSAIKELGGTITKTEQLALKRIFTATLSASRANDLVQKLKLIGDMKENNLVQNSRRDRMVIRIELDKSTTPE